MFSPPNIPNQFPPPQGQEVQEKKKRLLPEIFRSVISSLVLVGLVVLVAWIIIAEISGIGGGFGSTVMDWVNQASINPADRGFTFFLRLIFTTGFVALVVAFLKKKSGDPNE